jgi:hypothetical protein
VEEERKNEGREHSRRACGGGAVDLGRERNGFTDAVGEIIGKFAFVMAMPSASKADLVIHGIVAHPDHL